MTLMQPSFSAAQFQEKNERGKIFLCVSEKLCAQHGRGTIAPEFDFSSLIFLLKK